jgi:hypothetical protein
LLFLLVPLASLVVQRKELNAMEKPEQQGRRLSGRAPGYPAFLRSKTSWASSTPEAVDHEV